MPELNKKLLLASSSQYRKQQLDRLGIAFDQQDPDIDESTLPDEIPKDLALRLSIEKARSLADANPNTLIIGSDQVATLGDKQLHKPGTYQNAKRQLSACSGKKVVFYSGVCLLDTSDMSYHAEVVPFTVVFRKLEENEITEYLKTDKPYDCAGSFRFESQGIRLFRSCSGEDPSSIIGLPLIKLYDFIKSYIKQSHGKLT